MQSQKQLGRRRTIQPMLCCCCRCATRVRCLLHELQLARLFTRAQRPCLCIQARRPSSFSKPPRKRCCLSHHHYLQGAVLLRAKCRLHSTWVPALCQSPKTVHQQPDGKCTLTGNVTPHRLAKAKSVST